MDLGAKNHSHPPRRQPRRATDSGVTQKELAGLHGVTDETIRLWGLAGLPRRDDGSYIVAETITWRVQRELEKERAKSKGEDKPKVTEMNRKLAVEADLKELQLQRERGEVVPIEDFDEVTQRLIGGMAAVAAGRLQRFERPIVQSKSAAEARLLTQKIHAALMEGAQEFGRELEAEAAEHDAAVDREAEDPRPKAKAKKERKK